MTTYTYQATDSSGKTVDGNVDALSLQAAREEVLALGLEPIEIYEAATSASETSEAPWVDAVKSAPEKKSQTKERVPQSDIAYFPLLDTLRLYAGWLLAWYCLVFAVGSYQFTKDIPFHVPYAESLFLSPLVLSFTFAAYLFLLLTGIYTQTGRSKKIGLVLSTIGVVVFILYKMNIQ